MKTTIEIADALMAEARQAAEQGGTTLRALVEEGLRKLLAERKRRRAQPFRLRDASVKGKGLQPGLREGDWETIRNLIYEGRS